MWRTEGKPYVWGMIVRDALYEVLSENESHLLSRRKGHSTMERVRENRLISIAFSEDDVFLWTWTYFA
ncbi:hypothetical protein GWI33_001127 [Rhynchophorus ferrugineus]|uniref:Uncharacterized protein n=1 Tax=Rhynchophorus ferrugineus TaxID=354439 RepID=A0A834HQ89_RHYFE|nr:hypothetical protein GWI33_001127 [Rhynchophorus ferrugineus]